jgi:hypothetical protein
VGAGDETAALRCSFNLVYCSLQNAVTMMAGGV